jgi:hypothetical protein
MTQTTVKEIVRFAVETKCICNRAFNTEFYELDNGQAYYALQLHRTEAAAIEEIRQVAQDCREEGVVIDDDDDFTLQVTIGSDGSVADSRGDITAYVASHLNITVEAVTQSLVGYFNQAEEVVSPVV